MRLRPALAVFLGAGILLSPAVASAGVPTDTIDTGTSSWTGIQDHSSDYCTGQAPFAAEDAGLSADGGKDDAFDGGGAVYVDGTPYATGGNETVGDLSIAGPAVDISGLDVSVSWSSVADANWIRQIITVSNDSGAAISVPIRIETNLGADGGTYVTGLGDGWFSVADDASSPDDVPVTFLVNGANGAVKPDLFMGCDGSEAALTAGAGNEDVIVRFASRSYAPGETVHIVLFYALSPTIAGSVAFGSNAADATAYGNGLFDGLTDEEMASVINWNLSALPSTGTSSIPLVATALGLALAGAFVASLRRRTA